MERYIVLTCHTTFALVATGLFTLMLLAAEIQLSGGDILVLTELQK